jgi:formate hydrogenlyase subunit 6/NADH:ubiquinone oxidoreductase subunit I
MWLSLKYLWSARHRREQDIRQLDFFEHQQGLATLEFPHETIPVPDHGRYKLHNEIDDCIVCDKCAKICPVNCIDIIPIRSPEVIGETSDGTPKRLYAEKFDIDMSKCMFCGLCTTVCPTECLTMTPEYDYSTFDIRDHIFPFDNMTEQEKAEKKALWEAHEKEKAARSASVGKKPSASGGSRPKPAFKPRVVPKKKNNDD